mmetsp:Transcript_54957/g.112229  ORF Transcript_54957/g.112229 Transcript_54957/m.112229 type:complete len:229 (+) Transcript_54957:221-907(+)
MGELKIIRRCPSRAARCQTRTAGASCYGRTASRRTRGGGTSRARARPYPDSSLPALPFRIQTPGPCAASLMSCPPSSRRACTARDLEPSPPLSPWRAAHLCRRRMQAVASSSMHCRHIAPGQASLPTHRPGQAEKYLRNPLNPQGLKHQRNSVSPECSCPVASALGSRQAAVGPSRNQRKGQIYMGEASPVQQHSPTHTHQGQDLDIVGFDQLDQASRLYQNRRMDCA